MSGEGKPLQLVLHMGPHKTATSYLQYNFHHSRAELLQKGWLYPVTGERVRTAHHDISDQRKNILDDGNRMALELRAIGEDARARGLNVLLSSEGFEHWRPRPLNRLKELVGLDEFHVVYAIRDPLDLLYAKWAQRTKTGNTESLPEYHAKHFADPLESSALNPMLQLTPTLKHTGARVTLLLYDEIVKQKLDIFSVFLERALGVTGIVPATQDARNQRFPIELTEFMRALAPLANPVADKTKIQFGSAIDHLLTEGFKQQVVDVIRSKAPESRRELEVQRAGSGLISIEKLILREAGHLLFPQPPQAGRLFEKEQASWVHYDAEALRQNPDVRKLMDQALRRVGSGSTWLRGANALFGAAISMRQLRKRLFR